MPFVPIFNTLQSLSDKGQGCSMKLTHHHKSQVHCSSGNRCGVVWFPHVVWVNGRTGNVGAKRWWRDHVVRMETDDALFDCTRFCMGAFFFFFMNGSVGPVKFSGRWCNRGLIFFMGVVTVVWLFRLFPWSHNSFWKLSVSTPSTLAFLFWSSQFCWSFVQTKVGTQTLKPLLRTVNSWSRSETTSLGL